MSHNSWDTRFGPRSARRTRTSSLVCASSAYRLTSHSHSPTQRCDGKACATRAAQSHSPNVAIVFIFSDLGRARSSSTTRRSACVVAPTFGRHVLLSTSSGHFNFLRFFGHRPFILYVDTCCVWGGFGRFQTYLGATTRCLLFAGTGGVFTQWANPPPYSLCFVLFVLFFSLDRQRSFQTKEPYIIVSWDRPAVEERSLVAIE